MLHGSNFFDGPWTERQVLDAVGPNEDVVLQSHAAAPPERLDALQVQKAPPPRPADDPKIASKSKKKPATTPSDGHESPRRREAAGPPLGAEIRRPIPARFFHGLWHIANACSASLLLVALDPVERSPSD